MEPHINKVYHYRITTPKFLFEYIKFLRHISKDKYDIVHMHLPVAGWMGIVAKLFCRKTKFIYSEHNLVNHYTKYNYYLSGLTYGFFDAVIYVSHEVGEVIRKIQKGWFYKVQKGVTILNGIDTNKYSSTHRSGQDISKSMTVGLVARFRPQKRVDRWAEVAAEVHKLNPAIKFLMVGNGPDDEMLRNKIKELGMEGKIELPGAMSDTASAYKRFDIFLLTSDFEGLPLAIMEAMSTGTLQIKAKFDPLCAGILPIFLVDGVPLDPGNGIQAVPFAIQRVELVGWPQEEARRNDGQGDKNQTSCCGFH